MELAVALSVFAPLSNNLLFLLPARVRDISTAVGASTAGLAGLIWLQINGQLGVANLRATVLASAIILGVGGVALIAFYAVPTLTRRLEDRRIGQMSEREFALHAGLRIPIATALAEEAIFRGLLWFTIESIAGPVWALAVTAVGFGLWHVVVSARQGRDLGTGVVRWVLISVVATTVAGLGFGWLRMVTGGLLAPFVAHCALNVVGSMGARIRAKRHPAPVPSVV